jgi:hypothetical protein
MISDTVSKGLLASWLKGWNEPEHKIRLSWGTAVTLQTCGRPLWYQGRALGACSAARADCQTGFRLAPQGTTPVRGCPCRSPWATNYSLMKGSYLTINNKGRF